MVTKANESKTLTRQFCSCKLKIKFDIRNFNSNQI